MGVGTKPATIVQRAPPSPSFTIKVNLFVWWRSLRKADALPNALLKSILVTLAYQNPSWPLTCSHFWKEIIKCQSLRTTHSLHKTQQGEPCHFSVLTNCYFLAKQERQETDLKVLVKLSFFFTKLAWHKPKTKPKNKVLTIDAICWLLLLHVIYILPLWLPWNVMPLCETAVWSATSALALHPLFMPSLSTPNFPAGSSGKLDGGGEWEDQRWRQGGQWTVTGRGRTRLMLMSALYVQGRWLV